MRQHPPDRDARARHGALPLNYSGCATSFGLGGAILLLTLAVFLAGERLVGTKANKPEPTPAPAVPGHIDRVAEDV